MLRDSKGVFRKGNNVRDFEKGFPYFQSLKLAEAARSVQDLDINTS